jgi:hypothetical protein
MTRDGLVTWLVSFVADVLDVAPTQIDRCAVWEELGVDSATILVMVADLATDLGLSVRPVEVLRNMTIDELATHLANRPVAA